MANDVQIAVYLDEDTKAALDELRRTEGVATNAFIRLAIAERLDRLRAEKMQKSPAAAE